MTDPRPDPRRPPARPLAPGDDAAEGTPGTGEDVCRVCRGTGKVDGRTCENCLGTGIVIEGIGGA